MRTYFTGQNLDAETLVVIRGVEPGDPNAASKRDTRDALAFRGRSRRLVLNLVTTAILERLFGRDRAAWVGQTISIYPSTTRHGGGRSLCVRVREHDRRAA
jgi:hypothetical protein